MPSPSLHTGWLLHWADSEVAALIPEPDQCGTAPCPETLRIRLSAGHVSDDSRQAETGHLNWGFVRGVVLTLTRVTHLDIDPGCIGRLSRGLLHTAHGHRRNAIELPGHCGGPLQLEWHFANGSCLMASAWALSCTPEEADGFSPSLAC